MSHLNRRNFLKMAGLSSSLLLFPKLTTWAEQNLKLNDAGLPNIIVLVFDAMTARNLSLYGYKRQTSSNLEKFASHATVYHSHYSGGNFTIPGTASILTGTYPWTHRALNFRGVMKRSMVGNDVFSILKNGYTRLAFPQNFWANFLLTQFKEQLEILLPASAFSEFDLLFSNYFPNDGNMAARALDDFVFKGGDWSASLLFTPLERAYYVSQKNQLPHDGYPKKIPYQLDYPVHFKLEKIFQGLMSTFSDLKPPFFTYLHLLPPHAPYTPSNDFAKLFKDGLDVTFPQKPEHRLASQKSIAEMLAQRRLYDAYVAMTDYEFGKFYDFLKSSGLLENSYIFITSDHGEMFERGEIAHSTPLVYEPVIHIPLLVSSPGQKFRRDVYTPTSAVDILPTIAYLTGNSLPPKVEGRLLPGLGGKEDRDRSIYVIDAKLNAANRPLDTGTFALRKGNLKLIHYKGYDIKKVFELYDLENDPEELDNLYRVETTIAAQMREELFEALHVADEPYL